MIKAVWFKSPAGRWIPRPCSWQGWVCLLSFFLIVVADFLRLDSRSHSVSDTIRPWIIDVVILAGILFLLSRFTAEKRPQ